MAPIFLVFEKLNNDSQIIQLPKPQPFATTWLPNECNATIDTTCFRDAAHCTIRIQVYPDYLLLSVFDHRYGPVSILMPTGESIEMPYSTVADAKSFVLLDGYQFTCLNGRWKVEFDYDHSISNSMKPPPVPTASPRRGDLDILHDKAENFENDTDHMLIDPPNDDSGYFEGNTSEITTTGSHVKTVPIAVHDTRYCPSTRIQELVVPTNSDESVVRHDHLQLQPPEGIASSDHKAPQSSIVRPRNEDMVCSHDSPPEGCYAQREEMDLEDTGSASDTLSDVEECDTNYGLVQDPIEHSLVANDTLFRRVTGEESQPIPQVATLDIFRRSAGEESQTLPRSKLQKAAQQEPTVSSPLPEEDTDLGVFQRAAGAESQIIPDPLAPYPIDHDSGDGSQAIPSGSDAHQQSAGSKQTSDLRFQRSGHLQDRALLAQDLPASSSVMPRQTTAPSQNPGARSATMAPTKEPRNNPQTPNTTKRIRSVSRASGMSSLGIRLEDTRLSGPDEEGSETSSTPLRERRTKPATVDDVDDTEIETDTIAVRRPQKRQKTTRQRRRTGGPDQTGLPANPRVVFSTACEIQNKKKAITIFKEIGGILVDDVIDADVLCVPEGGLKKTPKFILALVLGKFIVTEKWIVESGRKRVLQDPASYLPRDKIREREWKFKLADAVERSQSADGVLSKLLLGWKVFVTPQLGRELGKLLDEFKVIASAMGAENTRLRLPSKMVRNSGSLVLGSQDDPDGPGVGKLGHKLYNKDVLIMAALRGQLELDSEEFELQVRIKDEEGSGDELSH